ncbi:MAG: hypothetical protein PHF37_00540 [Phycisphaerae bacterium]|nr:hypothetical protein [Phycisphaerae bacterium]
MSASASLVDLTKSVMTRSEWAAQQPRYFGYVPQGDRVGYENYVALYERELQRQRTQGLLGKYMKEYQSAFDEAKTANEQRYNQILGGYDTLFNDTMTGLEGMGDAARKDVNTGYNKAFSQSMQGLVNSGLANSTIIPSVTLNNTRQRTDALNSLNEMLRREKLGYMNNITGNKLAFMERREDTYPDLGLYIQLMQGLGNVSPPT